MVSVPGGLDRRPDAGTDGQRLFVYGTLLPGRLRWPLLAPFAVAHRPATVRGRLFDSGRGWPVAVFDGQPGGPHGPDGPAVPGVVVELHAHRADDAIALLDEVEGVAVDLLRRVVVTTLAGDSAWAYHHPHPVDGLVAIPSWAEVPLHAER
ncbi:MAG TPA: gamma-glutamylcyclotransferase [Acidimicrobiales bacterium]|nr:gamma-glutamylcyclotransferase [Acidimicrobiales bacterium]